MKNIDLYCNFIEIRDEIKRVHNIISNKETRVAILNSQLKTTKITDKISIISTNDSMNSKLVERDMLIQELVKLDETLPELEEKHNKLLKEIEDNRTNETKTNYLEINIFYYRYVCRRIYTLEDIQNMLSIPYQESQIKKVSSELTSSINKELNTRFKNRTKIVL